MGFQEYFEVYIQYLVSIPMVVRSRLCKRNGRNKLRVIVELSSLTLKLAVPVFFLTEKIQKQIC